MTASSAHADTAVLRFSDRQVTDSLTTCTINFEMMHASFPTDHHQRAKLLCFDAVAFAETRIDVDQSVSTIEGQENS
jgi:hypothetical protein